ncbi:MAG: hypothetical protein GYB64_19905, partial [Chloroflexi bacterium]|nr:hypothetical protein [Chloroflexota bacterium]
MSGSTRRPTFRLARFALICLLVALALPLVHPPVVVRADSTGTTTRVSIGAAQVPANDQSFRPAISGDGRFVAFDSDASNLVSDDSNAATDVFLHDTQTGRITRLSVASDGTQSDDRSSTPAISADGRFVVFGSLASNLVANDTNAESDVFLYDRQTGTTTCISVDADGAPGDGASYGVSISADGRYVAFSSNATNLIPDDTNGAGDVFLYDREADTMTRLSVASDGTPGDGNSAWPVMSADGRYVAFHTTATNLGGGEPSSNFQVILHDRETGTSTLVSRNTDGTASTGGSFYPSIAADGRTIIFGSFAPGLIADDTNNAYDLFRYDTQTGAITLVSATPDGSLADGRSDNGRITADGRFVVFESEAGNLVADDTNNRKDVFVRDLTTDTTTRISLAADGGETAANSLEPTISANGDYLAFASSAADLVDGLTNTTRSIFYYDRTTSTTTALSLVRAEANGDSLDASLADDGQTVAFFSAASNLVLEDTNNADDVFVYDRTTETTTRVSVASDGTQSDADSQYLALAGNGQVVAFQSIATNLVPDDTNGVSDKFVHDRATATTTRVSLSSDGAEADRRSAGPVISADGRAVAFYSEATNLVPDDTNARSDIFVHDRDTGTTTRVSVASDGTQANNSSFDRNISADGRFVAFVSDATNLVPNDTNGARDLFVHDRDTGTTTRVSVASDGTQADAGAGSPTLSADGRFIAFASEATNLVPDDTNNRNDVFLHDRETGTTTRISVAPDGTELDDLSSAPDLSPDGRYVAFISSATNLVDRDTSGGWNVYIHDRQTGTTTLQPDTIDGSATGGATYSPSLSADGQAVAFESTVAVLVSGDTNGRRD